MPSDTTGSHLAENEITQRFLARWDGEPAERLRDLADSTKIPFSFRNRFLTRPGFLGAEQVRSVTQDLDDLLTLLYALPSRVFGGDAAAMAHAVGLSPVQCDVVARTATGDPARYGRADLYYDGRDFRLLEFNVTSALGGWELPHLNRWLLRDPMLASFVEDEGLEYPDTVALFADLIRAECTGLDCPSRPVVAVAEWPTTYEKGIERIGHLSRTLGSYGFDAYPCHIGQLTSRDDHIFLDGRHVDVVLRWFPVSEFENDPAALALVEPVITAVERGAVGMFSSFSAALFATKGALALLHDEDHRDVLSPAERALVDRFVPWTKELRDTEADADGQRVDLVDYTLANRSRLILKPTHHYGGTGVLPGWTADEQTWAEAVRTGLKNHYVVQRRVQPATERFPASDTATGTREMSVNWGIFLTGHSYGGTMIRALPGADAGVVNSSIGAASNCTFHAPQS